MKLSDHFKAASSTGATISTEKLVALLKKLPGKEVPVVYDGKGCFALIDLTKELARK
ncbi:hypothetical protein [Frateuria terrea]|nr:hypothetical protein [Frateuria terrea]